jgi:hypothetical protein
MLGHGFIEHLANLHHPKIMHHNCVDGVKPLLLI